MVNVIGIGNLLKGDDAIGPFVIEKIDKMSSLENVNSINAGADAFAVLDYLLGIGSVV